MRQLFIETYFYIKELYIITRNLFWFLKFKSNSESNSTNSENTPSGIDFYYQLKILVFFFPHFQNFYAKPLLNVNFYFYQMIKKLFLHMCIEMVNSGAYFYF